MSRRYPGISNPTGGLESLITTVQDLRLAYQALVGVPKYSELAVASEIEIKHLLSEVNARLKDVEARLDAGGL